MRISDRKIWMSALAALVFGASAVSAFGTYFSINVFIPSFLGNELALKIFLLLAGILLLYDSFNVRTLAGRIRLSAIIAGFILAFLGAFPLLHQLGLLDFMPFVVEFTLNSAVLAGMLLFYSLYLLWDVSLFLRQMY